MKYHRNVHKDADEAKVVALIIVALFCAAVYFFS